MARATRSSADIATWAAACAVHLGVVAATRSSTTVTARLVRRLASSGALPATGRRDRRGVGRIEWAVRTSSATLVPCATCLTEAIATVLLCRLAGHPAGLRFGVSAVGPDGLRAHAWAALAGANAVEFDRTWLPLDCRRP
jgi:hypothetical protein